MTTMTPQMNNGRERMRKASAIAMEGRATVLAAQWSDGDKDRVRIVLGKIASAEGAMAVATLISRKLHDNGDDWRGFGDWLVENSFQRPAA